MFQIIRTFLLVNISWYFDMGVSLTAAFVMIKNTVVNFNLQVLTDGTLLTLGLDKLDYIQLGAGCAVLFGISVLQERGVRIRESLAQKPLILRWSVYLALMFSLPLFGYIAVGEGGFIYAQF